MEEKLKHWKQITEQWRRSGKAQREFCEEHGIKLSTLRYWIGRVKNAEEENSQVKDLVCISLPTPVAVRSEIILEVDDRYRIKLPAGFETEALKKILAVIG